MEAVTRVTEETQVLVALAKLNGAEFVAVHLNYTAAKMLQINSSWVTEHPHVFDTRDSRGLFWIVDEMEKRVYAFYGKPPI